MGRLRQFVGVVLAAMMLPICLMGLGWTKPSAGSSSAGTIKVISTTASATVAAPATPATTTPATTAAPAAAAVGQAVVLDGQPLFQVGGAGELTAQERASSIEQELNELAADPDPKTIFLEVRNEVPVILVNGDYLMSVTQLDATLGRSETPRAQAERLSRALQTALNRAQQERQKGYLSQALLYAALALLAAAAAHWLLGRLWFLTLRPLMAAITFSHQEDEPEATGSNLLLGLTLALARLLVWLGAALYVTNLFPFTRRLTYAATTGLANGLFARSLSLGERNYSVLDLLILFGVLLGLVIAASAVTNLLRS
ncbi:MAG TPA: hypothetical protein V6D06_18715, partial [Trichocoleus sp.]